MSTIVNETRTSGTFAKGTIVKVGGLPYELLAEATVTPALYFPETSHLHLGASTTPSLPVAEQLKCHRLDRSLAD